ncbi:MAG TPA: cytochrome c [Steroidobacteraceae bacterium]|nr:cytochrome c [Steroidobacteraceae bacterium]
MRCGIRLAVLVALLVLPSLTWAQAVPHGQDFALIERGRYLTALADCAACHDDPVSQRPFAGGRSIQTPFGMLVAPNITPDMASGIGGWSDAQFDAAVRYGRMPSGARLYPAMPYLYYSRMSRSDTQAIRAYLATVKPVSHNVVSDQLPFPFKVRALMRVWDALFFHPSPWHARADRSAAWNRGAWIVEGPGHCEACHTPKGWLAQDKHARALQGYVTQGWFAPDISPDAQRGLGGWSEQDIEQFLQRGHNRLAAAAGPMGEEVEDSSSQMRPDDLLAIATYLKSSGTGAAPASHVALAATDARMRAGAAIYRDECSACHRLDGHGTPYLFPDLVSDNAVQARDPTSLLRVVLIGTRSVATNPEPTAPAMPGFRWQLSDAEVASVLTYVRNSWGHAASPVSADQVSHARSQLQRESAAE